MTNNADAILYYHQRSKHQLNAYAKGPASLDWDDQPQPFRRFIGCQTVALPSPGADVALRFSELDRPQDLAPQALNLQSLGLLLELAFGLSAWKQFGPDRWALRCNPSSGNLHPTEAYLISLGGKTLSGGVYHYVSHDHQLERRGQFADDDERNDELLIGLSSIHWREAWKYGERAFRYCQHDVGHALAALSYAAASLGWRVEWLSELADVDVALCLGLDRTEDFIALEHETPDLLCRLHCSSPTTDFDVEHLRRQLKTADWFGKAEPLSAHHLYRWPVIDEVTVQAGKPTTASQRWQPEWLSLPAVVHDLPASQLIRQRRSAQHFNPKSDALPLAAFQRMLAALMANDKPPFTAWNGPPQIDVFVFVHRVAGLAPGLYMLLRTGNIDALRSCLSPEFRWQPLDIQLPFYLLVEGNVRQAARTLSCHQPIASDSAFSLGMLADFTDNIEQAAWRYRQLFWECGMLGQILYLEAEAAGVRGTGIGCFFDDAVHGVLGLQDNVRQSLYHFTVGEPLDDPRLETLPPYRHLFAQDE